MRPVIPRVHPMRCTCPACRPHMPSRLLWISTSILAFGGSLAMAIDASGNTPALAQLLGLLS